MSYSPIPLPFAGTGEYIAASASFEQVCQLPVKANQRKEMAAGWLLSVSQSSSQLLPPIARLGKTRVQSLAARLPASCHRQGKPAFTTTNPR